MEDLREIRRRLAVIETTGQITKTMRIIAATNLKRVQPYVDKAEEYARGLTEIAGRVAAAAPRVSGVAGAPAGHASAPLAGHAPGRPGGGEESRRPCYLVVTSDKGLAGGYAVSVIEAVISHHKRISGDGPRPGNPPRLGAAPPLALAAGLKGARMLGRRGWRILDQGFESPDRPDVATAEKIARRIWEVYQSGEADVIFLAYTRFVSTGSRNPVVERLLPPEPLEANRPGGPGGKAAKAGPSPAMLFEPGPARLARRVFPEYLFARIFSAMIHAKASEFAARLMAMESASDNAEEMAKELSFLYHRARQAEITQEISEIITGHESLR